MAGRFQPTVFGVTVIVISISVLTILALSTPDEGLALQIQPPQLRIVGECFRSPACDADPEPNISGGGTIILTDPNDATNTIEEQILLGGGIMVIEDPVTGEQTVVIAGTDQPADVFPSEECPEGQMFFDPNIADGIRGMCWDVTFVDTQGKEFVTKEVKDTVACWLNVHSDVINSEGVKVGAEQSSFFKTEPVPQLTLVDIPTGAELVGEGGFRLFPMLKCATNTQEGGIVTEEAFPDIPIELLYIFPSFDTPLKLEATKLTARVYSSVPPDIPLLRIAPTERIGEVSEAISESTVVVGKLVDTFNFMFDVPALDITSADSRNLGEIFIPAERILVFIPDGKYASEQQIVLEGTLVLHWDTGIPSVDNIPLVIKLQTIETRDGEGNILSVVNPLKIFRDIRVERNVGEDPPIPDVCVPPEILINQECTIIDKPCPPNTFFINGQCQPLGEDGDPTVGKENILDRFITCIQSGSPDCLLSTEFFIIYLVSIGGIVLIGGLSQRNQPQIYGVPRGF